MNICMLLARRDFPPDIRVEKEARALVAAGHQVVIVCDQLRNRPLDGRWEGCQIRRVPSSQSRVSNRLNYFLRLLTFRDWRWYGQARQLLCSQGIDVLHVHDLPMVGTGLALGRRFGVHVIADLHENYPAALTYYGSGKISWRGRLLEFLYTRSRWEAYEHRCALAADRVLVVVDEAKARLIDVGVPEDKIVVIENTVDTERFLGLSVGEEIISRYAADFVIAYIGGFGGAHRGLDTAVEAMPAILREIPNARLLLVGEGAIRPKLEEMIAQRSLSERVTFVDWQPFEKVPSFIRASAVCLVPHQSNAHTEATSPHKLFQYMLMGKPVVVSNCRPLRRVVEETGAGVVFQAGDSRSLAQAIVGLRDEGLRERLGKMGRRAVLNKYNWRETSKKLLSVYDELDKS